MFCTTCGKELLTEAKFCTSCGSEIKSTKKEENTFNKDKVQYSECKANPILSKTDSSETKKFEFEKRKMLGNLTYLSVKTEIEITNESIDIFRQNKIFGFLSAGGKKWNKQLNNINSVNTKNKMDLFDGILGTGFGIVTIISLFLNLINGEDSNWIFTLICFVVSAFCFFTGYGKEVLINTNDNDNFKFPTSGVEKEIDILIDIFKNKN